MDQADILKQSETWYIVNKKKPKGPYSYIEIAKQLDLKKISLDTLVTRRKEDLSGIRIGEISDFSEEEISAFIARTSPPHTSLHSSRSFVRASIEEEAFLKLPFGNKVSVKIKSISAGGCKVESNTRLEGLSLNDEIQFIVPSLGKIHPEPIKIKTFILKQKLSGFHNMNKFESLLSFKKISFDDKAKIIEGVQKLSFDWMTPFDEPDEKKRRITDILIDKIKNI